MGLSLAATSHERAVLDLILMDCGVNDETSALWIAMAELLCNTPGENTEEILRVFFSARAVKTAKHNHFSSLLTFAVKENDNRNVLVLLLLDADPNALDHEDHSPLCWAARLGNTRVATSLLGAGASVDLPDSSGMTPLAMAEKKGDSSFCDILNYHVQHSRRGVTPTRVAVTRHMIIKDDALTFDS